MSLWNSHWLVLEKNSICFLQQEQLDPWKSGLSFVGFRPFSKQRIYSGFVKITSGLIYMGMFVRHKLGYEFLSITAGSHRGDTLGCKCLAVVKVHLPAELVLPALCSYVVNCSSKVPVLRGYLFIYLFIISPAIEIGLLPLLTNFLSLLPRIFQVQQPCCDRIIPSWFWLLRQLVCFCIYVLRKKKRGFKTYFCQIW